MADMKILKPYDSWIMPPPSQPDKVIKIWKLHVKTFDTKQAQIFNNILRNLFVTKYLFSTLFKDEPE